MKYEFIENNVFNSGPHKNGISPTETIPKGTIFHSFGHLEYSKNCPHSFQVSENLYVKDLEIISKINHSCDPNVIVDVDRKVCESIKDISPGENLSYFYPSTELNQMVNEFDCQ